jgi:very-short-patch-repair endonuclease
MKIRTSWNKGLTKNVDDRIKFTKVLKYCKNNKCNKGNNNSKNIVIGPANNKFCSHECWREYHNYPFYCSNVNCNKGDNGGHKKLTIRTQIKYCSKNCQPGGIGKRTIKTKNKISNESKKQHKINPNFGMGGKKHTKESIEKIRKNKTGRILSNQQKEKMSIANTGKKHTPEAKRKMRISVIKYIKENHDGKIRCRIGKNETQLLNEQEMKDNCKINRHYEIKYLGYIVDGYCKETNTVYEVYEKGHYKNEKKINKDLERQKEIENYFKCNFIIIKDI